VRDVAKVGVRGQTLHSIQPYSPPVPVYPIPLPLYLGGNGVHHASTPCESYLRGQGALIQSQGQYNLLDGMGQVLREQARRLEIENRERRIISRCAMKDKNRRERDEARGPRPTPQQLRDRAAKGRPDPLSPGELDAVTGELSWPALLKEDDYTAFRAELEKLFAQRAVAGHLEAADLRRAELAADGITEKLRSHVHEIGANHEYSAAMRFLKSLAYEVQQPAG